MSGSLNKAIIVGNLGVTLKYARHNAEIRLLILPSPPRKGMRDWAGETQEKTEWHRVVLFGKIAEVAERYLARGSKVLIEGTKPENGKIIQAMIVIRPRLSFLLWWGDDDA